MKWTMYAKMIADSSTPIGIGSLVCHNDKTAIVTDIGDIKCSDGREESMYTLTSFDNSDDSAPIQCELSELCQFDGTIKFHVRRMNIQGGGILCRDRGEEESYSMKWVDPVTEKQDEPDGFHCGCWYFDPFQQDDPLELVNDDKVKALRRDFIKMCEENETEMLTQGGLQLHIFQMSLALLKVGSMKEFNQVLLAVPFVLYSDIVHYYLKLVKEEDDTEIEWWCSAFFLLIKVGVYLRNDDEWTKANSKIEAYIKTKTDEPMEFLFDRAIHKMTNHVGEWFEAEKEFRAAIWCYAQNLEDLRDETKMTTIPPETRKTLTVDMLSYIGLANKRMDNFIEAFKCYEEAIIIKSTANSPNEGQPIIGNGKVLQQAAKEWYGTSGKITSWESPEDVDVPNKCQSCNGEGTLRACAACQLVCYCKVECQRDHWQKVHKHTCLGKLRGR